MSNFCLASMNTWLLTVVFIKCPLAMNCLDQSSAIKWFLFSSLENTPVSAAWNHEYTFHRRSNWPIVLEAETSKWLISVRWHINKTKWRRDWSLFVHFNVLYSDISSLFLEGIPTDPSPTVFVPCRVRHVDWCMKASLRPKMAETLRSMGKSVRADGILPSSLTCPIERHGIVCLVVIGGREWFTLFCVDYSNNWNMLWQSVTKI